MKRDALQLLVKWKNQKRRKPLIVRGARQTGKTWLMKEFGRQEFKETVYINFENEPRFRDLFLQDYDTKRIIYTIQIFYGKPIDADTTLIIFDEIQAVEGGLTSLKYFCEEAPQYAVIAAGSLLGISLHEKNSFPVGKVSFIDLHPLSFEEFLMANGKEMLVDVMRKGQWDILRSFHTELLMFLRYYMFVGGMPEVVQRWIDTKEFSEVRDVQHEILRSYQADFSKHVPKEQVPRLDMVWNSLPAQLSKENKKFVYGVMRDGARAKDFELAIMWLFDCGLVLKSNRVSAARMPLVAYQDLHVFKLFMVDVGLLSAMSGLDEKTLIDGNAIFTEFKGALTEQFVMQNLATIATDYIGYWTNDRSTSEIDFLVQQQGDIIPIEVKSGENLRSRSFTLFCQTYQPVCAVKTSLLPFHSDTKIQNVPLYGLSTYLRTRGEVPIDGE
ncbi:MAG: ATP-binding protein [Paludibacteraceae bacterium]|nr:ATP-binding protein [Paludibacteraceae bacterium]